MIDIRIFENSTIIQAMKLLATSAQKCLVVVKPKSNFFLGTLTDGDLRRAIINGNNLNKTIKNVYFKPSDYLIEDEYTKEDVKKIFISKKKELIPIINKKGIFISYLNWRDYIKNPKKDVFEKIDFIIMAGGRGKRMEPFTSVLPKPLIPFKDKPLLQHIIEKIKNYNPNKIILSLNYKAAIIKSFIKELKLNKKIEYITEKKPQGTIGSIKLYEKKLTKNFFVLNADTVVDIDYEDLLKIHKKNKNLLTVVVSTQEYVYPYGNCKIDKQGNLEKIEEKPKFQFLTNLGLYIMDRSVLKLIKKNKFYNTTDLINDLINKKSKVGIYPVSQESWNDFGEWSKYIGNYK